MSQHYLCIGSSAASLATASKLRQLDATARITVLTAEKEMPYNRCSLADYLAGERSNEKIRTRSAQFFSENSIELKRDTPIVSIDASKQQVTTKDGANFGYDKLFLGAGKSSYKPTLPGSTGQGVFSFYDLDDSNAILKYIQSAGVKHCTVIGSGVTGLECADALLRRGLLVAVVGRSSQILSQQLDEQGAQFLEQYINKSGVELYKNAQVQEIQHVQDKVYGVRLADGCLIRTDMVIFTIGGKSNSFLAQSAGIVTEKAGIVINQYLQTNIETIYAGGDIAIVQNLLTQQQEKNSLWSDASMQGLFAASNMVGVPKVYPGILPITSTTIFGTNVASIGIARQSVEYKNVVKQDQQSYHRFMFHDGVLKGFVMIGNVANIGKLRQILLSKQVVASTL